MSRDAIVSDVKCHRNCATFFLALIMKASTTIVFVFVLSFVQLHAQYQPTWESLDSRPIPEWYEDAKFGIFIHWGVYSVPAWSPVGQYAEWFWYYLSENSSKYVEFNTDVYGKGHKYQDFAPHFGAKLWDPDSWAALFSQAGAKYVVPTSKHHEGYTLWPSPTSWNWNSVDVGPERDIIKQLFAALKKYPDIHACAYFSLYEWFNPLYKGPDPHMYVDQVMLPQMYDLVNTYEPDLLWTDGDWDQTYEFWNATEFIAWLYNDSPVKDTVVINDRWGRFTHGLHGGFYTAEYKAQVYLDHKWEANRGCGFSFGYNRAEQATDYFTSQELLYELIRTVAYGGNYLLDVGPRDDGYIPVVMQERLLDIGNWLKLYGDAIYSTRKWFAQSDPLSGSGSVYYTVSKDHTVVNVIFLEWPSNNTLSLFFPKPTENSKLVLLNYKGSPLKYSYYNDTMMVYLPPFESSTTMPCQYAWAIQMYNVQTPSYSINNLQGYYCSHWNDHALCGTEKCAQTVRGTLGNCPDNNYSYDAIEGIALNANSTDVCDIPLTLYYSAQKHDFALVANHNISDSSYQFLSIEGYACPHAAPGYIPLDLYLKANDYWLVGSEISRRSAQNSGYKFVGRQGYAIAGPTYQSFKQSPRYQKLEHLNRRKP